VKRHQLIFLHSGSGETLHYRLELLPREKDFLSTSITLLANDEPTGTRSRQTLMYSEINHSQVFIFCNPSPETLIAHGAKCALKDQNQQKPR
tara:strand:+ start:66 stop:341 length:276 start_codon:yes stop_codon:yes gene_type:complete